MSERVCIDLTRNPMTGERDMKRVRSLCRRYAIRPVGSMWWTITKAMDLLVDGYTSDQIMQILDVPTATKYGSSLCDTVRQLEFLVLSKKHLVYADRERVQEVLP